jgi:hypothetical protein
MRQEFQFNSARERKERNFNTSKQTKLNENTEVTHKEFMSGEKQTILFH